MSDNSMYVAASEIAERLGDQVAWLERIAHDLEDLESEAIDLRERFALAIAGDVFQAMGLVGLGTPGPEKLAYAAKRIWLLAEAVIAAYPKLVDNDADTPYPDKPASDLEEGIDLSGPPEVS